MLHQAANRPEMAVAAFHEVVRLRPGAAVAWCNLGTIHRRQGHLEEAIEAYRRAVQQEPELAEAWAGLAAALQHRGRRDDAIAAYREALRLRPSTSMAGSSSPGFSSRAARTTRPSKPTARRLGEPGRAATWYNLAVLLREQGRAEEAVSAFLETIRLKPDDPDPWLGLGLAYAAQGKRDGVLEVHHQLAILDPRVAEELARAHLPDLATHEEWPKEPTSRRRGPATPTPGDAWYEMAVMYRRQGEDDQAVAAFQEAVRFEPRHAKAWYALALLHHKHRRLLEAKSAFHQLVRLKPDLAPVWRQVGALYRELGQGQKAMRAYQRALGLRPQSVEAWCGFAQAAAMAGDAAAVDDARRTLATLDPKMAARLTSWLESSAPRA
jgi:superkiller protein 3